MDLLKARIDRKMEQKMETLSKDICRMLVEHLNGGTMNRNSRVERPRDFPRGRTDEIMSSGKSSTSTTTTKDSGRTTTTWSPCMDNIIETPKTEVERKEIDEQINKTLYGSSKITRRLSVFKESCPSTNENKKHEEKAD
ncbi:hypothetical protein LWI28_023076 [Acer negundo]|uniref:Uncharacterized protein n=1 Tax=Acer negundo TaxID=4023 RepID=A0AAD5J0U2_ACENE|nr:hypothetical protein LWI28_023076 [Acer negundo]